MILISFLLLLKFQKGFVEAHADDGYVEIFGLKHGWHASMVMVELISAKHIAQVFYLLTRACSLYHMDSSHALLHSFL